MRGNRFFLVFCISIKVYALSLPRNISDIPVNVVSELPISHCVRAPVSINAWRNLQFQHQPFPDPNNDIATPLGNDTTLNSLSQFNISLPSSPAVTSSDTVNFTRPRLNASDGCIQLRNFQFSNTEGYIRTRRVTLDWDQAEYWLIWDTDSPIHLTVWQSDSKGSDHFRKLNEKIQDEAGAGWVPPMHTPTSVKAVDIMVDFNVPPGSSGEISLFRTHTFPRPWTTTSIAAARVMEATPVVVA